MRGTVRPAVLMVSILLVLLTGAAVAQYDFELPRMEATVNINHDGSCDIYYAISFINRSWVQPVDIVDIGMPQDTYDLDYAAAWLTPPLDADDVAGWDSDDMSEYTNRCSDEGTLIPLEGVYTSEYVDPGIEVHLDPVLDEDQFATLVFQVRVYHFIYPDDEKDDYASVEFAPTWFGSEFVSGTKDQTVKIIFPPGVTQEETVWHRREFDAWDSIGEGESRQLMFIWRDPNLGTGYQSDAVGVSFPREYLAADAVYEPSALEEFFKSVWGFIVNLFYALGWCWVPIGFFLLTTILSYIRQKRRRLEYLPPSASVEGVGIKRGLTAVEAAVLLEQPLDRILNLIIFGLLKKGRIEIIERDPLRLRELPAGTSVGAAAAPPKLRSYEKKLLEAVDDQGKLKKGEVRKLFVALINSVNKKLKGFSRRETREYYRGVIARAWSQVEAAGTDDLKLETWDRELQWVMLDEDFGDRTKRTFDDVVIYHPPYWWYHYHGGYGRGVGSGGLGGSGGGSGGPGAPDRLPTLPGSDFANEIAGGAESFAGSVMGDVGSFTSDVTNVTNPVPVSTSSGGGFSGGGGSGCACACACAGCACACAGGGR